MFYMPTLPRPQKLKKPIKSIVLLTTFTRYSFLNQVILNALNSVVSEEIKKLRFSNVYFFLFHTKKSRAAL